MATWKEEERDGGRATEAEGMEDAAERLAVLAERAAAGWEPQTGQLRRYHPRRLHPPRRQLQRHGVRWPGGGSLADEAADTAAA
jgi:hypothetical protein